MNHKALTDSHLWPRRGTKEVRSIPNKSDWLTPETRYFGQLLPACAAALASSAITTRDANGHVEALVRSVARAVMPHGSRSAVDDLVANIHVRSAEMNARRTSQDPLVWSWPLLREVAKKVLWETHWNRGKRLSTEGDVHQVIDENADPCLIAQRREACRQLRGVIDSLPASDRRVLNESFGELGGATDADVENAGNDRPSRTIVEVLKRVRDSILSSAPDLQDW